MKSLRVPTRLARPTIFVFAVIYTSLLAGNVAAQEGVVTSDQLLPPNTTGWVSVPDAKALKAAIEGTQFGEMMNDPNVKPFIDDLARQMREYLDEQNIRFGMKLEDIEQVHSGEICLAGVLRKSAEGVQDGVTDHAIVLLVDVADTKVKAAELLEKVGREFSEIEAKEEKIEINEVTGSKWAFKEPQGLRKKQFAYHAIVGDWLLATDNESAFRDIINRIGKATEKAAVLSETEAFAKIFEKCNFKTEKYTPQIRWFVEPFGYVQLAQAIADAQNSGEGKRNKIAEKFHEEGFSAIKGVGGVVSFATGDHEAAHRTFVYAPAVTDDEERYARAAAMLDFRNKEGSQLTPPVWIPENSAGYLTFTWDLAKALDRVGSIIDKTSGTKDSFKRALESMKTDPKGPRVDIPDLIGKLHERITICSITRTPIDDESERVVFGVQMKDVADQAFIAEAISRLVKNAVVVEFNGHKILVVNTADTVGNFNLDKDFDDEFGGDDAFGGDPLADEEPETGEELKPAKPLFEKRVITVAEGYVLIGNNVDQVKSILEQLPESPGEALAEAVDYIRVSEALKALAGDAAPSLRHFGRLDKTLHTNYEMLRTNRMPQSKTILGQLLNRAYTTEDMPEGYVRKQEVDGSKMPDDYEGQVARYFGPTGQVVHSLDDGWLITGVVLKKEPSEMNTRADTKEELAVDNK